MRRFRFNCGTSTCRYTIFGITFGLCFPLAAIFFDVSIHQGLKLNTTSIIRVHSENPLHYIIDMAPVILGIAFGIAGFLKEKSRRLNRSLRQQAKTLKDANTRLTKAINDINEAKNLLVKSENLASLGQLTAGIAHEIKNPINFITNFSESSFEILDELLESKNDDEKKEAVEILRGNFQIIYDHGIRANNILQSMMTFARSGNVKKRLSDINLVCKDAADIAYHGMSSSIIGFKCDFQKNLTPGLPKTVMMYEDISRVILNLLTNAFYSVNERSKKEGDKHQAKVILSTGLNIAATSDSKDKIFITVWDNGMGIPQHIKEKIFNPFFTTKPSGEGTGLGLSISQDIILVHGGEMTVTSEENNFTEFRVTLPVITVLEGEEIILK